MNKITANVNVDDDNDNSVQFLFDERLSQKRLANLARDIRDIKGVKNVYPGKTGLQLDIALTSRGISNAKYARKTTNKIIAAAKQHNITVNALVYLSFFS